MNSALGKDMEAIELNDLADRLQSSPMKRWYKRDLSRLQELLTKRGEDDGSIVLQEHWSLYYSLIGQTEQQKRHLHRTVELITMLLEMGGPVAEFDQKYIDKLKGRLNNLA